MGKSPLKEYKQNNQKCPIIIMKPKANVSSWLTEKSIHQIPESNNFNSELSEHVS